MNLKYGSAYAALFTNFGFNNDSLSYCTQFTNPVCELVLWLGRAATSPNVINR